MLAVLLVSSYWGLVMGLLTAIMGAAAWNLFHIPPTGRFTIAEGENWVALAVFLIAAVAISELAGRHSGTGPRDRETRGGAKPI